MKEKTLHQNWTNAFWEVIGGMKFIGQENVQRSQWTIFQVGMLAHGHLRLDVKYQSALSCARRARTRLLYQETA